MNFDIHRLSDEHVSVGYITIDLLNSEDIKTI